MKCYISLNIKVISQYQFVCTRLSSAHTPTRKLAGVWALDKLVHTNRYCEITYNIHTHTHSGSNNMYASSQTFGKTENFLAAILQLRVF